MEKNVISNDKIWNDIIKYLDINDFFNLELSNKSLRSRVTKYYKETTEQFNEKSLKAIKRLFFSMYYNSFVVFNVREEYCATKEEETKKVSNTLTNTNTTFMDNSVSSVQNVNDNSLFGHNKLINDIITKEDRIFVLYHSSEIKVFSMNLYGQFTFEMRICFPNVDIKKMVLIHEYNTFIILSNEGKLFSFYYPKIDELVNTDLYITLSEISDLGIVIKNIYSIKGYLLLIDEKDNIYFINSYCFNKEDIVVPVAENTENEPKEPVVLDKTIKMHSIERNYFNIVKVASSDSNLMFMDDSFKV
jgi:hypothetical protein